MDLVSSFFIKQSSEQIIIKKYFEKTLMDKITQLIIDLIINQYLILEELKLFEKAVKFNHHLLPLYKGVLYNYHMNQRVFILEPDDIKWYLNHQVTFNSIEFSDRKKTEQKVYR